MLRVTKIPSPSGEKEGGESVKGNKCLKRGTVEIMAIRDSCFLGVLPLLLPTCQEVLGWNRPQPFFRNSVEVNDHGAS